MKGFAYLFGVRKEMERPKLSEVLHRQSSETAPSTVKLRKSSKTRSASEKASSTRPCSQTSASSGYTSCESPSSLNEMPIPFSYPRSKPSLTPSSLGDSCNSSMTCYDSPWENEHCNLLEKRQAEIVTLRRRMEINEQAMLSAYRQRREEWRAEMNSVVEGYQSRQQDQQNAFNATEQSLRKVIAELTAENNQLKAKVYNTQKSAEQISEEKFQSYCQEIERVQEQCEHSTRKLIRMATECEVVRKQNSELAKQLERMQHSLELSDHAAERKRTKEEVERLNAALQKTEEAHKETSEEYSHHRETCEKERQVVLRYQRELHGKYIQVSKRNEELEERLSIHINSRRSKTKTTNFDANPAIRHSKVTFKIVKTQVMESDC